MSASLPLGKLGKICEVGKIVVIAGTGVGAELGGPDKDAVIMVGSTGFTGASIPSVIILSAIGLFGKSC